MPAGTTPLCTALSRLCAVDFMELAERPIADHWVRVDQLLERNWWSSTIERYCNYVHTQKLAVGAACALQHYTGRWVKTPIAVWLMTGTLLDLAPTSWWALVDDDGATRKVAYTGSDVGTEGVSLADVTSAIVDHVDVMVDHVHVIGKITRARALSGVAASVAGTWCRLWHSASVHDRPRMRELAEQMLRDPAWGREPLVDFVVGSGAQPLNFRRRHCCLIRLGKDHGKCQQCPHYDEAQPEPMARGGVIPDFLVAKIVRRS